LLNGSRLCQIILFGTASIQTFESCTLAFINERKQNWEKGISKHRFSYYITQLFKPMLTKIWVFSIEK